MEERRKSKANIDNCRTRNQKANAMKQYNIADRKVKKSCRRNKRKWISDKAYKAEEATSKQDKKTLYRITKNLSERRRQIIKRWYKYTVNCRSCLTVECWRFYQESYPTLRARSTRLEAKMAPMTLVLMVCVAGVFAVPTAAPTPAAKGKYEHLTLPINERGTKFNEEVDVNHDGKVVIFEVPDHNTVSNSMVMLDFNTRKMMTLYAKREECLLSDMPEDMAQFEQVEEGLKMVADPNVNTRITSTRSVETVDIVVRDQLHDRSSLGPEMQEMCAKFEIHTLEAIGEDVEIEIEEEKEKSELDRLFGRSSRVRRRTVELKCTPPEFKYRCSLKTDSCIYYYTCNAIANRPGQVPTAAQCTDNHLYHSDAWQCTPFCP
ncbi:uncharacterized protein LOC144884665 [Branchiostoma floridae x Branchiostoma japonicum]